MVPGTIVLVLFSTVCIAQNIWISSDCPKDSTTELLLPHEDDCTKYYLCNKGLKVLKQCPEETSFHIGLQGCEWSQDVTCQHTTPQPPKLLELLEQQVSLRKNQSDDCPSDPSIEQLLPHSTDCSKYYQCTHGIKLEKRCPKTLHFDVSAQTCTYPNIADCKLPQSVESTTADYTEIPLDSETEEHRKITKFTSTPKHKFFPNGCPADMYSYYLLPHENDCKKYYHCNHGDKILKECPADLHFDYDLQGCNWSNVVKCNTKDPTTPIYHETTPEVPITTEFTTIDNYLPNGCHKDPHIHHLLPHETDCTKFYQCDHGERALKNCPGGLHFDVAYQVCNWPEAANCHTIEFITTEGIRTTEEDYYTTASHYEIRTTPTMGHASTTNYVPTISFNPTTKIPLVPTEAVTSPKPTTEKMDLSTLWYDWTTLQPTENLEFETDTIDYFATTTKGTTYHDYVSTVDNHITTNSYVPTVTFPTTRRETVAPEVVTRTELPSTLAQNSTHTTVETTTYRPTTTYEITNKPTTNKPTDKPIEIPQNTKTTEDYKTTEYITVGTEESHVTPESSPCLPGFYGNMAHPDLCNAYYLCSAGLAIPLFCPNGYEFDPDIKICTPIKPGGCTLGGDGAYTTLDPLVTKDSIVDRVTENTPAFKTTTELTTKETITDTTTVKTTEATDITSNHTTIQPPVNCPPGLIELVPNPAECTSYYMCFGGSALIMHCPVGLEYDINSKTCVAIQDGGCTLGGNSPLPKTTTSYVDTTFVDTAPPTMPTTTVTTTSKPTTPSICPPGAAVSMPDPTKCNLYYLCTGGMAIGPLYCPTGQEFDFDTKSCTTIKEGGCTSTSSSTESSTSESSSTELSTVETSTIESSTTETSTTESDYDETTTQSVTQTESVTEPSWNQPGVPETTIAVTESELINTSTTEKVAATTEYIPVTTEYIPVTTEYIPVTTEYIPETTEYVPVTTDNEPTTTAYFPETTEKIPETTEMVTNPTTYVPIATESVEELPQPLCPPSVIVNVPHPEICDAYYLCFSGSAIAMYCPPGQEFDANAKACVIIKDGGCTYNHAILTSLPTFKSTLFDFDFEPSDETKQLTVSDSSEKQTTEVLKTTIDLQSSKSICGPNDFGHKPHPEMCNAFYMCTGGTAIPLLCAEGLEFDINSGLCEEIREGGCTFNMSSALLITPDNQTTSDTTIKTAEMKNIIRGICNVTDFGYIPHPDKCDAYYMCTGGIAVPLKCQKGYEFNSNSKKCILITTGGCFARKLFFKRTPHIKRQTFILNRWHQK